MNFQRILKLNLIFSIFEEEILKKKKPKFAFQNFSLEIVLFVCKLLYYFNKRVAKWLQKHL